METGTILDRRYELPSVIGDGSESVVYKAKHLLMNKHVVIKILRRELLDTIGMLDYYLEFLHASKRDAELSKALELRGRLLRAAGATAGK